MSLLSKQLLKAQTLKFRALLEKERFFGQYPLSLTLLKESALSQLENIKNTLGIDISNLVDFNIEDLRLLKNFIKNNPRLASLLKFADKELTDDIVSELLLRCENANNPEDIKDFEDFKFYSDITNSIIEAANDVLSKVDDFVNGANNFIDSNMQYIEAGVMAYYIIRMIIDLIRRTDFPSTFRLKYLQKLIRYTLASIWEYSEDQYQKIKSWLTNIDNLLVLLAAAGAAYLINRKASQDAAIELMLENACPKTKEIYEQSLLPEPEPSVGGFDIDLSASCPIPDNNFVPKEPYDNKLENFSCPIDTEIDPITAPEYPDQLDVDLATKAKILNNRDALLEINVSKNQFVTTQTIIASIQGTPVYSPVEGYIESFNNKEIVLNDISDPERDELIISVDSLNEKYRELNEIKTILKDYEIDCLYPIMLKESPISDGELTPEELQNIVYFKMEDQFNKISEKWYGTKDVKGILEDYEKRVEKITSENNVREHAENETTYKIKEELDKEENKVFKFLLKADDEGLKLARQTKALNGEYELLEYYINNIVLELNENEITDEEEDNLEYLPGFRVHMNDFIRERYIIEGWKPKKISDKAIELLKDLERGATNGTKLWKTGLEKYNERKKLSDVRYWLENSIKPKRKLETNEVENLINRIFFLYEFYLDIEAFTEEYKNLEESNTREQTNREGTYLHEFFQKLQVRYKELPKEIKTLEKRIEDLSILSQYYEQTIDQTPYRIYSITPKESDCLSSYAKEAGSKYDLDDIRYWIKWCGYATLTGLVPLYWSTGLFAPGPIALPVVYIPIKAVRTKYGVILFGITVTGIYPFPLVLLANESSDYESIIPIPGVSFIKEQITNIKKEIIEQLSDFTKNVLKTRLDNLTEEINDLNNEINSFEKQLFTIKVNRPARTKENTLVYLEWVNRKKNVTEQKTKIEVERWKKEQTHQVINNAYTSGSSVKGTGDPSLDALEKTEESINSKLDNLISQFDKIDNILAPLPTTLDPYSINFGFTLKNPKPTIKIVDKINENINETVVKTVTQPFQLNNENFMSGPVKFNKTGYDAALSLSRWTMVQKDPFPKYEEIGVINLPFQKFLTTEFLPKGAQTYGIPGQLPAPVG
jgi:hypothetical protein